MHIVFCCDNIFLPHCTTTIVSIIQNNREENIKFHIICSECTLGNRQLIENWLINFKGCFRVYFYSINNNDFADFPLEKSYINISTYYRLALPKILTDIDKVLYFDCDIIVNSGLKDLWNTDIENIAMAGILDRHSGSVRLYNRLGYPMEYGYINAGVLLINLKKWREEDVFSKALTLAKEKSCYLKNHDQDILNILFYNNKKVLDFKYNLLEWYLYVEDHLYLEKKYYSEIIKACNNPTIIHFCMPVKPWHYECINPFKNLYYKYKAMTPWPEVRLIHRKEKLSAKMRLKRLLGKLGLYHIEVKPTLRKDINVIEDPDNVLF